MKTITFDANELRALDCLLWTNPCDATCAYPEMRNSKNDCNKCKLSEAIQSITDKLQKE